MLIGKSKVRATVGTEICLKQTVIVSVRIRINTKKKAN